MTRTKQNTPRSELVRQRRTQQTQQRLTQTRKTVYRPETIFLPVPPRPVKQTRAPQGKATRPAALKVLSAKKSRRQRYDIAFTMGRTDVRTPGIAIPQFGTRWLSGLLCAALIFILYSVWTSATFKVSGAEISGNQRLGETEINAALRVIGQPIFVANPAKITENLLNAYPDLSSVDVHVAFPNRIIVDVVERTPLIAWYQDGTLAWIDAQGIGFPPRGQAGNLINVVANGDPPPVQVDPAQSSNQKPPFLDPAMVQVITVLYSYVPGGASLLYDPQFGLGWQDVRGWQVYFGQNSDDIPLKLNVYQAIVDRLTNQGIRPALISMEYPDAPFFR
ncbi:MAG: FtsQ-type POTRA domain-containing protein [Anaerolineales bacterium]|nr:FtsQ-type POTRA domain-containing protein [Anaerolineales bacterium]